MRVFNRLSLLLLKISVLFFIFLRFDILPHKLRLFFAQIWSFVSSGSSSCSFLSDPSICSRNIANHNALTVGSMAVDPPSHRFSSVVCLSLLICNCLQICSWFHLHSVLLHFFVECYNKSPTFGCNISNISRNCCADTIFAVGIEKTVLGQLKKDHDLGHKITDLKEQEKSENYFGRLVRFTRTGVMDETDRNHVDSLLKEMGLESCGSSTVFHH